MTSFTELTWVEDHPLCKRFGHAWQPVGRCANGPCPHKCRVPCLYKCTRDGRLGFGPALNAPGVARHPIVSQRSAATTPGTPRRQP